MNWCESVLMRVLMRVLWWMWNRMIELENFARLWVSWNDVIKVKANQSLHFKNKRNRKIRKSAIFRNISGSWCMMVANASKRNWRKKRFLMSFFMKHFMVIHAVYIFLLSYSDSSCVGIFHIQNSVIDNCNYSLCHQNYFIAIKQTGSFCLPKSMQFLASLYATCALE